MAPVREEGWKPQKEEAGHDGLAWEEEGSPIPPSPKMLDKPADWKPRWSRQPNDDEQRLLKHVSQRMGWAKGYIERVADGKLRGFAWSGPPGLGKTHTTLSVLQTKKVKHSYLRGRGSALGLYRALFEHRDEVVVLDDLDDVWRNHHSIELLKSGTERDGPRLLQWNTRQAPKYNPDEQSMTDAEVRLTGGTDSKGRVMLTRFRFEGAIIILTNARLTKLAQEKKVLGLDPLLDRLHYIDLKHRDRKAVMLWCEKVCAEEAMLHRMGLCADQEAKVLALVRKHMGEWRSLSLRLVQKAAENLRDSPDDWEGLTMGEFK